MKILTRNLAAGIVCTSVLSACGGSSSSSSDPVSPDIISDPNPEVSFFNDAAKTDYVDSMLGRFVSMFRPLSALSDGLLLKRTTAATEVETISCSGGGAIAASLTTDDVTEEITGASISFDNCIEDGETSNGSISVSANLDQSGDNGTVSLAASNLTVTGGDENISINGAVNVEMQTVGDQSTFTISGSNFSMTAGSESITFSNYSLTAIDNETTDAGSLSASMTVSSSIDGTVTFVIDPPLSSDGSSDYPLNGTLSMTHSDGSSLTLNADNGDPETFSYSINDNGSITTGVQRWDETEIADL